MTEIRFITSLLLDQELYKCIVPSLFYVQLICLMVTHALLVYEHFDNYDCLITNLKLSTALMHREEYGTWPN